MKKIALLAAAGTTIALFAGAGTGTQVATAAPNAACAALDDAVYEAVGSDGASLFSPWADEVTKATKQGFTAKGTAFRASTTAAPGLVGVHRLYAKANRDFLYTTSTSEVTSATKKHGYVDQGVRFYVASAGSSCTKAVPRLVKGGLHRLAPTAAEASALTAAGWTPEKTNFNVASTATTTPTKPTPAPPGPTPPAPTKPNQSSVFTFAVIPDTQMEVLQSNDTRLAARNRWLNSQGVAFAAQTGDLVNWDTDAHEQYQRAKAGMDVLTANQIPYTVAVGNHDTMATGVGGSARGGKTWEQVRDTRTLNHYFTATDFGDVSGAFEPGKIDNVYATYEAGGEKWMVLTLEFCPRKAAVAWAAKVVAAHPDTNVIISTHYYLSSKATIAKDSQGYGDTSPQYIYDHLVSQYPNIKMVFSGHVGYAKKSRVDTGVHGNKIHSFLTTFHEGQTNPVRMLTVDTAKDTVSSTIYAPFSGRSWHEYDEKITDMDFD
ncbi:metallophosphoesterase [uncultured Friedmanniella sp.]|uniref:metallophosphoesterase n=1 Tax=uncultured Friedmanniella sp. TaxID=335381 RepID=UPI0035C9DD0E